jgi:hypothetical protein
MTKRDNTGMEVDQEGDSPSQGRGNPCVATHQQCGSCKTAYTGSHEWWLWRRPVAARYVSQWLCVNCQAKKLGWVQPATKAALLGTLIVRR